MRTAPRLNEQYVALRIAVGNQVVLAPIALKDGDSVLDCATGTGACELPDPTEGDPCPVNQASIKSGRDTFVPSPGLCSDSRR